MLGIGEKGSEARRSGFTPAECLSFLWKEFEAIKLPFSSERRHLFTHYLRAMLEYESEPYPSEVLWVRTQTMALDESPTNFPHRIAPAATVRLCPFGHRSMLEGDAARSVITEIEQYVEGAYL